MPTYRYTAKDQDGKSVSGKIAADNEAAIVVELRKRNLIILTIQEAKESSLKKAGSPKAQGGKKVFEKLKIIVELLGAADAAQGAADTAAARAASAAAAKQAESTLVRKFIELLSKKTVGQVEAGGVAFSDIQVALEGAELQVRRSFIVNVSRAPQQGRAMQAVWESAAIQAARQFSVRLRRQQG